MIPIESSSPRFSGFDRIRALAFGAAAGVTAGFVMLTAKAFLRLSFYLASPTGMILDRLFSQVEKA